MTTGAEDLQIALVTGGTSGIGRIVGAATSATLVGADPDWP